jgi:hypothetical protein
MPLFPIDNFNPEEPFIYNGVCFDFQHGSGSTGNTGNVNYAGFVVFLEPQTFLQLCLPLLDERPTVSFFQEKLPTGEWCIGPPQLSLWPRNYRAWHDPDAPPVDRSSWEVKGHEGRHRSLTLLRLGFDLIPVCIFPVNERSRDIDEEFINNLRYLRSEGNDPSQLANWVRFKPDYYIIDKKVFVIAPTRRVAEYKASLWKKPTTIITEQQKTPRPPPWEDSFYYWSKPVL